MGIFSKFDLLNQKEFNLKEAIQNDKVHLIFGNSLEILNEYKEIRDIEDENTKQPMILMIRNRIEDNIPHGFSMKLIPEGSRRKKKNI